MTRTDDPWKGLGPASGPGLVNALRVDPGLERDFFWARSMDGKCLLLLRYAPEARPKGEMPKLKAIEVEIYTSQPGEPEVLAFKLADSTFRDLFERLCRDIVASSGHAASDHEAVQIALSRTWRWHHLLRGGASGRLSPEEQKGLLGELLLLERILLPTLPPAAAVGAWQGPSGAPKDFTVGKIAIEMKARRGSGAPYVTISSEHQLDTSGVDALFLGVVQLDAVPAETGTGVSVCEVVRRIRAQLSDKAPPVVTLFEQMHEEAGLATDDDYSDERWLEGPIRFYRVEAGFPRLSASQTAPGISHVRYSLSLPSCEPYETDEADLITTLQDSANVH